MNWIQYNTMTLFILEWWNEICMCVRGGYREKGYDREFVKSTLQTKFRTIIGRHNTLLLLKACQATKSYQEMGSWLIQRYKGSNFRIDGVAKSFKQGKVTATFWYTMIQ